MYPTLFIQNHNFIVTSKELRLIFSIALAVNEDGCVLQEIE